MRKNKKLIAILTTLVMLAALLVPMASPALAATQMTALQRPNVDDDRDQKLGTVLIEISPGALSSGDSVNLRLPTDFIFRGGVGKSSTVTDVYKNYIEVPASYGGDLNLIDVEDINITLLKNNEVKVSVKDNTTFVPGGEGYFLLLHMGQVYIDTDFQGDVELMASGPSGTGFPLGKVIVGRAGGGVVSLAVIDSPTFSDNTDKKIDPLTIRLEEDIAGALEKDDESLKITLPSGFEWQKVGADDISSIWTSLDKLKASVGNEDLPLCLAVEHVPVLPGQERTDVDIYTDEDELIIEVKNEITEAVCLELTLGINVEDESLAKEGDVKVKVSGSSDTNISEGIVGYYGENKVNIDIKGDVPQLFAGMLEQEIPDIVIKETIKESLTTGRTIVLTLPSNAKWGKIDESDSDANVDIDFVGFVGDDGRAIKYKVGNEKSTDEAELVLEDMEVVLEPGVEGDLELEVSGTQGLDGKLTIAKVVTSIKATCSEKPGVKIGMQSQAAGDITITEQMAEAIQDDKNLIIDLPDGVKFTTVPKVEVTEGDLDIDLTGVKRQNDDNELLIPIDGKSTNASTIEITGIEYTVDRTVAEGDITVKIKGNAVIEVNDDDAMLDYWKEGTENNCKAGYDKDDAVIFKTKDGCDTIDVDNDGLWPATTTAAKVFNATNITPAPGEVKPGTAVFKIGDTKYKIGDKEETMDVAPYVKNNRTYLPVRYVAYALGVTTSNILWDNSNGTVTLIKGDRVIQVQIKSKVMLINGAKVVMDVAPELKDGRTMLPFRWIAQALGASVEWDEATQTVTLKL
ncbi:hypothetical protein HX99_02990 [Peptococcaceae bacterium SCADC1_2_3]|nr:hypothetical protein DK28_0201070 [Peptococcaceae bacterium SCADC1_2_3]KFI36612.1 hypothetical protein HX99_02990 [Peptococcaceae bacterium SCADC1_2_3]KFI37661.1 hypothetical protein HY02_04630 [Peptococcaceae bacterium SCADC1_2_3]